MNYKIKRTYMDLPEQPGKYYVHVDDHETFAGMLFEVYDLKSVEPIATPKHGYTDVSFEFTYNILDNNGIMFDESDLSVKNFITDIMKDVLMSGIKLLENAINSINEANKGRVLSDKEFATELEKHLNIT